MIIKSDYFLFKKPGSIPCVVNIYIPRSVTRMDPAPKFETDDGNLAFMISPAFTMSTSIKRKLAFSKERETQLDFQYLCVGTVEIDKEKIYLLLEKL